MQSKDGKVTSSEVQAAYTAQEMEDSNTLVLHLSDLIRYLWSKRKTILTVCLICGVLAVAYSFLIYAPPYEATKKLYLIGKSNSIIDLSSLEIGSSLSSDYQQIFSNKDIHDQMREKMPWLADMEDEQISDLITLSNAGSARILLVKVTWWHEKQAEKMVTEYCNAAEDFIVSRMGGQAPQVFEDVRVEEGRRYAILRTAITVILAGLVMVIVYSCRFFFDDRIFDRRFFRGYLDMNVLCALPSENEKKQPKKA